MRAYDIGVCACNVHCGGGGYVVVAVLCVVCWHVVCVLVCVFESGYIIFVCVKYMLYVCATYVGFRCVSYVCGYYYV